MRWVAEGNRLWIGLSWLGLLFLFALIVLFGTDTGVSYDENSQRTYGDLVLDWYRSGFKATGATTFGNLYLYGGLFDAPAQWLAQFSPIGIYETRHILTALAAVAGVIAAWKLAAALGGARAGFIGGALLALTPMWVGHGTMNPKDIPFAAAAAFASYSALRIAIGPAPIRLRDACWAGLTIGIALGVRPGGNFLWGYPCLAAGARLSLEVIRRRQAGEPLRLLRLAGNLIACIAIVFVISWPIMLIAWPWAQLDPLARPLQGMAAARHFDWVGTVLFDGGMVDSKEIPWSYLPVWFRVTLPETYLLAAIAALVVLVGVAVRRLWRAERALGFGMLAMFVFLPFAAALITQPVLYDAQRHFLFLLPPLAALSGCVLSEVVSAPWLPRIARGAFAGMLVAACVVVGVDIVQLHPFEYVYFNRLSGGLRKNYRKFETDYWSVGYRDGLKWILAELPPLNPNRRTRITACDLAGNERLEYYLTQWPGASEKVTVMRNFSRADVLVAVRRWDCHKRGDKTLHVVKRQDAPLVYVRGIDRRKKK
jgi:hypothetical protein